VAGGLVILSGIAAAGAPLLVTSTNDSGLGSLRQAILVANLTPGLDTIQFNIAGTPPFTIRLQNKLPQISDPVVIDGTTQPGFVNTPVIELDGTSAGGGSGLEIISGNCTVRGLAIHSFNQDGIKLSNVGGNVIDGCFIGTDATGTNALGNGQHGVEVLSDSNVVGETMGNIISASGQYGIRIQNANWTVIQGNLIGTDITGTNALGNGKDGVYLEQAVGTLVGGTNTLLGNTIAFNNGAGVNVHNNNATNNAILGNSIFLNSGLGIDLMGNGVTANHAGGKGSGPNNLQNFPLLSQATTFTNTTVQGILSSQSNTTYRLEFFSNAVCDPSGYGEGETLLGEAAVTIGASGSTNFYVAFPTLVSTGLCITATATDPSGNTSEFSPCLLVSAVPMAGVSGTQSGSATPSEGTANLSTSNNVSADAASAKTTLVSTLSAASATRNVRRALATAGTWMTSGSFMGDGSASRTISGLGFTPDVVIIKAINGQPALIRTSTMATNQSKQLDPSGNIQANAILSFTSDGFVVGANNSVNASSITNYWVAFRQVASQMQVGTFTGDGKNNRNITGVGFQPDYVLVLNGTGQGAFHRFPGMVGDASMAVNDGNPQPKYIEAMLADGFQVSNHNNVNQSGADIHYVAFHLTTGQVAGSNYVGNGSAANTITGVGFQPSYIFVQAALGGKGVVHRSASLPGSESQFFVGTPDSTSDIVQLQPDGFQVGSDQSVNSSGAINYYMAFADASSTPDLIVSATATPSPAIVNSNLTYSLTVANVGTLGATNVTVTNTLDASVTLRSATPSVGSCTQIAGVVTCNLGNIDTNGSATISIVVTPTVAGTITNTATAIDQNGDLNPANNTAITITAANNHVPPTITAPANVTVNTDPGVCYATGVALDSPTTSSTVGITSVVNDAPAQFPKGTITVTWTVTDNLGGTATATQTVTVVDAQPPTITAPANVTVSTDAGKNYASGVTLGTPTIADNCGVAGVTNNAPNRFPFGTNTVIWTVNDTSGNSATATQTVIVKDMDKPTIIAPVNVSAQTDPGTNIATGVVLGVPITADNVAVATVVNNAPAQYPLGTTPVIWTVADTSGNSATATQTVTVVNTQPPTIAAPANVTISTDADKNYASGVALGVPVTSSSVGVATVVNNAPLHFPVGVTYVTWTVTDVLGVQAQALQKITVVDTQLPTITAPVAITVSTDPGQCFATGVSLGNPVTADNVGVASVNNNGPATFPKGTTTVTWTVTDTSGNTATATQNVTVGDTEPPTITAPPDVTVKANRGKSYATGVALGSPTTADNCGVGSVHNNALTRIPVGTNAITWTVTDTSGNTATATQTVTVVGLSTGGADLTGSWVASKYGCFTNGAYIGRCYIVGYFEIDNIGSVRTTPCQINYYRSTNSVFDASATLILTKKVKRLAPGKSTRQLFGARLVPGNNPTGEHLIAVIDPTDVVAETTKTNNVIVDAPLQ